MGLSPIRRNNFSMIIGSALVAWTIFVSGVRSAEPARAPLEPLWEDLASDDETTALRASLALASRGQAVVPFLKERLKPVDAAPARMHKLLRDLDARDHTTRENASAELEYLGRYALEAVRKRLEIDAPLEFRWRAAHLLEDIGGSDTEPLQQIMADLGAKQIKIREGAIQAQLEQLILETERDELRVRLGKLHDEIGREQQPEKVQFLKEQLATCRRELADAEKAVAAKRSFTQAAAVVTVLQSVDARPHLTWLSAWRRTARSVVVLEHIGGPAVVPILENLASGEPEALPTVEAKAALGRLTGDRQSSP